ncbi:MAG: HNH endonuclease [Candidatus Micrarchaeia archaeon]
MPPPAVKTLRDLIYWQYAKIISESAGFGKANYAFIMDRYNKLRSGEVNWSSSVREYIKEHEKKSECVYCGAKTRLTLEHILPRARGGPDSTDNLVWVCGRCNSSKGGRRLYEWFGLERRNAVPRIAEGKYLKLLHALHDGLGTLDVSDVRTLCPRCDLQKKCPVKGKLTVLCLEGLFKAG